MKRRKAIIVLLLLFCLTIVKEVKASEYEYDKLNRVIKVIYDDGSYINYTYDANGNITQIHNYQTDGSEEEVIKPKEDHPNNEEGDGNPHDEYNPDEGQALDEDPYEEPASDYVNPSNHYIQIVKAQLRYLEEMLYLPNLTSRIPDNLPKQIKDKLDSAVKNHRLVQEISLKTGWANSQQIKRLLGLN